MVWQTWIIECLKIFLKNNCQNHKLHLEWKTCGCNWLWERSPFWHKNPKNRPTLTTVIHYSNDITHLRNSKVNGGYKFTNSQAKINQFMYIYGINVFAKNSEKEQVTLIQTIRMYSQDNGMEFCIEKYTIFIRKSKNKRNGVYRTNIWGKNRNARRERQFRALKNTKSKHH